MDILEPMYSLPTDKASSLADSVFCKLKMLLEELLTKVLESEMYKVYMEEYCCCQTTVDFIRHNLFAQAFDSSF
jgi:hypothetical protein